MDIHVPPAKALHFLGMARDQGDEALKARLAAACAEVTALARPRSTYRILPLERREGRLLLSEPGLELPGRDIARHLADCDACALMAATLGREVDAALTRCQQTDVERAVLLDACASAAVEELCDRVQTAIAAAAQERGRFLTARFSPGYGDLPLALQPELLRLLDAHRRIGLAATPTRILTPRKSVTALIGLADRVQEPTPACAVCPRAKTCQLRLKGLTCDP